MYLPPPSRGQPELFEHVRQAAVQELGAEPDALESSDRLADEWLGLIEAAGVRTLDLRPVFRAEATKLYWDQDLHLDLEGHRVVAEALEPVLSEQLASRGTPGDRD